MSRKRQYYDGEIPFSARGDQQHFPEDWPRGSLVWKDNFRFTDTLTFVDFSRGRSAAYAHFSRTDGTMVTVFLRDLKDLLRIMRDGAATGQFTFCKRGENYGCQVVTE